MSQRFDDHVVWITGGGSGIGKALALELAREGAHVVVSGRRVDRLEAVAHEVTSLGRQGVALTCDVTNEAEIADVVEQIVSRFGRLDVVIANAGFSVGGTFESLTADDWRRQLEVNVVGAVATITAALPHIKQAKGRAVWIASVAGNIALPRSGPYCASKFALRAAGLVLAQELHGTGASSTVLHPGYVESEINQVDNTGVFHPEREDRRPKKGMWTAEKAARVMARAIYRRKREFVFTKTGRLGTFMGRHMPGVAHFALTRKVAKKQSVKQIQT